MTENTMLVCRLIAYGGPEAVRLEELPPPAPGPGEVLLRLDAASLNPIDVKLRDGALQAFQSVTFPRTLGRDGAGTVIAAGDDAAFAPGDRVAGVAAMGRDGTHASHAILPAAQSALVPAGVSAVEAAAAGIAGLSALIPIEELSGLAPGSRILIHGGAGGVGLFAIQLARLAGAEVTATCSRENVEIVRNLGAEAIDYRAVDFARLGPVFDAVFDTVGGEVHARSFQVLKPGGRLVRLNAAPVPAPLRDDVSVTLAEIRPTPQRLSRLLALIAEGKVKPRIERAFTLAEHQDAYAYVGSGRTRGKAVFVC